MNIRKFFIKRTIGFLVIVVCVVAFFIFNNYILEKKPVVVEEQALPYRAALTGEYLCLPYKDADNKNNPTETDCEPGILTNTGDYYGINFFLMSQTHDPIEVGQKISAKGAVQSAESLSASHWQQYPIKGIFSVTDSLQVLDN